MERISTYSASPCPCHTTWVAWLFTPTPTLIFDNYSNQEEKKKDRHAEKGVSINLSLGVVRDPIPTMSSDACDAPEPGGDVHGSISFRGIGGKDNGLPIFKASGTREDNRFPLMEQ